MNRFHMVVIFGTKNENEMNLPLQRGHGTDILEKECQLISTRCAIPVVHLRLGFIIDSYSDFLKKQVN